MQNIDMKYTVPKNELDIKPYKEVKMRDSSWTVDKLRYIHHGLYSQDYINAHNSLWVAGVKAVL